MSGAPDCNCLDGRSSCNVIHDPADCLCDRCESGNQTRSSYARKYGAKYEKDLNRRDIAKRIREDIKAAVTSGELPAAKYSVRIQSYSGGGSITVTCTEVPGLEVLSAARVLADFDNHNSYSTLPWRSDAAAKLEAKLEAMVGAYNYDGSDSMSDHFDVNFYQHIEVGGALGRDQERTAILLRYGRVSEEDHGGVKVIARPTTPEAARLTVVQSMHDDEVVSRFETFLENCGGGK